MKKERLLELAGVLTEGVNSNKEYPVIVEVITPRKVLPELVEVTSDMVDNNELPKGTTMTIDVLNDQVMELFVKGMSIMYDRGGSDDRRADNYSDAMEKAIKLAVKLKNKG